MLAQARLVQKIRGNPIINLSSKTSLSLYNANNINQWSSNKRILQKSQFSTNKSINNASESPKMVTMTVDGIPVTIEAGSAVIQACEKAGVTIPRYCYHEKLAVAGNCRMCLVDNPRAPKPIASCSFPVANGMEIRTDTERVHKAREGVTEMILANHPLDCPVCDQGGECDLQDQSLRYGRDRGRFHEIAGKRAVENKNIGPLIKTVMTRCIQCTRCVRFANDVAGVPEFGTTGRGNDMSIGTYLERNLDSELSGNVIDLCPVGALTSKPTAFHARPWEYKKTESVDVHDALGSNIRIDSRGVEVMRIVPKINDDVNEEWISDKTRFAVDGLKTQRLTIPLVKVPVSSSSSLSEGYSLEPASWDEALSTIANAFEKIKPVGNEFKAIAGDLADVESLIALKDLANRLDSENLTLDSSPGYPAHGVDFRSNYSFNATIRGVEKADAILLVGTNPRKEAAVLNARIRKAWLQHDANGGPNHDEDTLPVGVIGPDFKSTFWYKNLGSTVTDLENTLAGSFGKTLANAKHPLIIVGSSIVQSPDAKLFYEVIGKFISKHESNFLTEEWTGYNVLQRAASHTGAYDVGFVPGKTVLDSKSNIKPKIIWLLEADEIDPARDIPADAFVIYQGHHGDVGAAYADVVLPGASYTEKTATYVNTEGRSQSTRAAVNPPEAAREDWKIIRAASEYLGVPLPYDNVYSLQARLAQISPHLIHHSIIEKTSLEFLKLGLKSNILTANKDSTSPTNTPLKPAITNFWFTNSIARSSPTMARCSASFQK